MDKKLLIKMDKKLLIKMDKKLLIKMDKKLLIKMDEKLLNKNEFYIHYTDSSQLEKFLKKNKKLLVIGHKCCSGKGCQIIEFDGKKITDNNEIDKIKSKY